MEQGNANYESIALGKRWPPLVMTLIFPAVWLLLIAIYFNLRLWDYTDIIVAVSLTPFAFYGPIVAMQQKWRRVDYLKADATGLLISYRYFPQFFSQEERVTRNLPWGNFEFTAKQTGDDGPPTYWVWLEISDQSLPSNFHSHPVPGVLPSLKDAQACVDQWNSCRGTAI